MGKQPGWRDTVNLPKTAFPMKANLPVREVEILKQWRERDIYGQIRRVRAGRPRYILHDGPPYANGHIHIGHALNKILKDFVVRYKTQRGYDSPFVPGWDCHGLPVEYELFKELGITKRQIGQLDFRRRAHEYAMRFVRLQSEEFQRLGVLGDWANPYLTLDPGYEACIAASFGRLVEGGYIYRGRKPVYWCAVCETALAEAEVEYEEHEAPSICVGFPVASPVGELPGSLGVDGTASVTLAVWTTTPWTLMGNVAVAVHPDMRYCALSLGEGRAVLVLSALADDFLERSGLSPAPRLGDCEGRQLAGLELEHPFLSRVVPVVCAEYVTAEQGTGAVHIAPGHGEEDYQVGLEYGLSVLSPVDEQGRFTSEAGDLAGTPVWDATGAIIEKAKAKGNLFYADAIMHSYPHCWRCHSPVIFRATAQWFMSMDHNGLRARAIEAASSAKWIPEASVNRITGMLQARPDWCLSRQRYWGVPIPTLTCTSCGEDFVTPRLCERARELFAKEGSDAWFARPVEDLVPEGTVCPSCGGSDFKRGEDILDVWFDSGVSHFAVLQERKGLEWPASLYLEGSDQHRGWFQLSLIPSVAITGHAPFQAVLTHGFVVDGEGRKMSKSLGNVVSPLDVVKEYGADVLRLWVASADYSSDVRMSEEILGRLVDAYRKIRNTLRFLLANTGDFDPLKPPPEEGYQGVDRYMASRLGWLVERVTAAMEEFRFYAAFHALYQFASVDLSAFYNDVLKDRLYTFAPDDPRRRAAQATLHRILHVLLRMLAPFLVFTAEEAWGHMQRLPGDPDSVHLSDWPDPEDYPRDVELEEEYRRLLEVRGEVYRVLEALRGAKEIGSGLEAKVTLCCEDAELFGLLERHQAELPSLFIVSQVELLGPEAEMPEGVSPAAELVGLYLGARTADGEKCERCWNWTTDVGKAGFPGVCSRCAGVLTSLGLRGDA